MALRVVSLVLITPTARALTPPTRVLPGRRTVAVAAAPRRSHARRGVRGADLPRLLQARVWRELWLRPVHIGGGALVLRARAPGIARAHAPRPRVLWRAAARSCCGGELAVAKFRKLRERK